MSQIELGFNLEQLSSTLNLTTPRGQVLHAMIGKLRSPDAFIVRHNNIERHGLSQVIVVDDASSQSHICMDYGHKGNQWPDHMRAVWIDEATQLIGNFWLTHRGYVNRHFTSYSARIPDSEWSRALENWKSIGGYDFLAGFKGQAMTDKQKRALARKIDGGQTNIQLTKSALDYIETRLDSALVPNIEPPTLPTLPSK